MKRLLPTSYNLIFP